MKTVLIFSMLFSVSLLGSVYAQNNTMITTLLDSLETNKNVNTYMKKHSMIVDACLLSDDHPFYTPECLKYYKMFNQKFNELLNITKTDVDKILFS